LTVFTYSRARLISASLPPQSLLPLLMSLMSAQPSLKSTILPLIPRPTLQTSLAVLSQSAKKLRDVYPYSIAPSPSAANVASTSFGFGSAFGSGRTNTFGDLSRQPTSFFAQAGGSGHTDGMRDEYILSRLRPHIDEFVSTCMSYLPYFSCVRTAQSMTSSSSSSSNSSPSSSNTSNLTALQALHKDKSHPRETFAFLSALTTHLLSQPTLTQTSLAPLLLPRLGEEWRAWVDRVDETVNQEGGMFGGETVSEWARGLDELVVESKGLEGYQGMMRDVRRRWLGKVGWLVGRIPVELMEEEG
jgi:Cut8, nuclear proteasome tether protein